MSDTAHAPVINKLIRVLDSEIEAGGGSALFELGVRVLALREPAKMPRTHRERRVAAINHEGKVWGEDIQTLLVEPFANQVAIQLLEGSHPEDGSDPDLPGPWWPLDSGACARVEARLRAEVDRVDQVVMRAIATYASTAKAAALRGAVKELELAIRRPAAETSDIGPQTAQAYADGLHSALQVLPFQARNIFVQHVRSRVEHGEEHLWSVGPSGDHWLSRKSWMNGWGPWEPGPFFAGELQVLYDHEREDALRRREAQDAESRKYQEAAERASRPPSRRDEGEPGAGAIDDAKVHEPTPQRAIPPTRRPRTDEDVLMAALNNVMNPGPSELTADEIALQARYDAEMARRAKDKEEYEEQLRSR